MALVVERYETPKTNDDFHIHRIQVEPFPDPSWKDDAHGATCRELPRIRSTGLEVGPTHGLGSTIYDDERDRDNHNSASGGPGMRRSRSWGAGARAGGDDDVFAAAARLRKGGKWLGELDVRLKVYAENPLLKRYISALKNSPPFQNVSGTKMLEMLQEPSNVRVIGDLWKFREY